MPAANGPQPARNPPTGNSNFAIVAIGASAGGLDACTKLISALPPASGMAYILVQHLDPTHESLMAGLLAAHTAMTVEEATDAMPLKAEHLYVIPPGTYLAVKEGVLHLSKPQARRGARLPFDFLLNSLAEDSGPRAACVILSGTGADGSLGLLSLKRHGGFVIAQDPEQAEYDGMPRSAIETGAVDAVLPIARMPAALTEFGRRVIDSLSWVDQEPAELSTIIELLRTTTPHDFRLYKPGTLKRRIERRMDLSGIEAGDLAGYLGLLREIAQERELLAQDLLINVTSFFRDPAAFAMLGTKVIPDLIRDHPADRALRVWIAGCSSGEETYSLAILLFEAIAAAKRRIKLQVFASDVDPDAIAAARDGFYPEAIAEHVSAERLAAFFVKEEQGYRVIPDLRAAVVFTVQDVLADPPFSRVDLISCRNLLIYLNPEAQAKVIALFHFALCQNGILFLGSSETPGDIEGRFEIISKSEGIYRHIGRSRPGALSFAIGDATSAVPRPDHIHTSSRQAELAELCRRTVLETQAPAAVLINRHAELLYSLGAIDRYLRVASGFPTHDLLAMATPALRTKLRSAIRQVSKDKPHVLIDHNRVGPLSFTIDVQSVTNDGEELLLVCFIDQPEVEQLPEDPGTPAESRRIAELERELDAARMELELAHQSIEDSIEEQQAITEEALSVNEEYQSTNEELLTSKEELQSLNEELTALNSQIQETLERQRRTSDDLQNILYSTNVATLFLDPELRIRFFTPATRSLFNLIPGDIGRPLADLHSLASDGDLTADASTVLHDQVPIEREIEKPDGAWFSRRILPYRAHDDRIEGIVITFTDITERKRVSSELEAAMRRAELANSAKSRFLAAASHDLRQPLQSLTLLHGLLASNPHGQKAPELIARLGQTLAAMSGMLNALLDINQIEVGAIEVNPVDFPINDILDRLRDEFAYQAEARRLSLRILPCSLSVRSDPILLEQMIRNLLANAMKYTGEGKILVGCRRHAGKLRIEIWDTGAGIAEADLSAIFEEFYQVEGRERESSRGLGLGLAIVRRLGGLLELDVKVRSMQGVGSVFSIGALDPGVSVTLKGAQGAAAEPDARATPKHGTIIVVEDDEEVGELLELLLRGEGHEVVTAPDGNAALKLVGAGAIRPDLILTDYNLPNGMNGVGVLTALRKLLHGRVPGIILTGDISTEALAEFALQDCVQLSKPVNASELTRVVAHLLPIRDPSEKAAAIEGGEETRLVYVVDDDADIRSSLRYVLEEDGKTVESFADAESFLAAYQAGNEGCLLIDANLPGMSGIELLESLHTAGNLMPAIVFTGNGDVAMAVAAMRAGALDFIEKPVARDVLLESIDRALRQSHDSELVKHEREAAARKIAGLTPRQLQIMELVLAGHPSKNIAADLGISQRTVENHRAAIMRKTATKSLPGLARLAVVAEIGDDLHPQPPHTS
jgi:two-component system CheB/CheR fusion protein